MASGSGGLAGGFADVRNFEVMAEQEDERRRAEALRELALERQHQQEDAANSPAGLLDAAMKGNRRAAVTGEAMGGADDWRYLNEQADRKLERRALELAKPSESAADRMMKDLGAAAPMAFETGEEKTFALQNDPRGRATDLQEMLDKMGGGKAKDSGPDAPIYYSGPPRHEGDPNDVMPYEGGLEGLRGANINRAAIRKEFGGTAPDETLSFTNIPKSVTPDMRRYDTGRGTQKDVGAPGGTLGDFGGGAGMGGAGGVKGKIRAVLQSEIEQAKLAPLTGREQAGEFVSSSPELNKAAQELDPNQLDNHIMQLVSDGKLSPQVGRIQSARYRSLAQQATRPENGEFDRDKYNMLVRREDAGSSPAALSMTAREGGGKVEQAEAQKTASLKAAAESPPGAPGTTRSPVETQGQPQPAAPLPPAPGESLGGPQQQGIGAVDWGQFKETAPRAVRVGAPLLGAAAGSLVGAPNVGAGVGGFIGELSAQQLAGEDVNLGRAAVTGAADFAGGKVLGGVFGVGKKALGLGREYLAGMRGAKAIGEGAEGSFGPAAFEPRTTTFQGETMAGPPLRETAGASGPGMSTLDRARQASAEVGSALPPTGAVPYNPARLPAVGRQNFEMGGEGPLLTPGRPPGRSPLQLEGPQGAAGDVFEGEVMDPADELLQLMSRGGGEGAKQLVPRLQSISPEAKEGLLEELRAALGNRRAQGMSSTPRDAAELLAMMMRAGG